MFLQVIFENHSEAAFTNFAIKLNANAFMLQVDDVNIESIPTLQPGETREVKIKLNS